jgi:radical SAM protein with 4Fe4S-binding SPASM domain
MKDLIIVLILVFIAAAIIFFLRQEKKKGNKCVGCPYGKSCSGSCQENNK